MSVIILASNNQSKIKELTPQLSALGYELANQGMYFTGEAEEPYGTYLENALSKARFASKLTCLPAIADDSGLTVPALTGIKNPGVDSAFYGTKFGYPRTDAGNNTALLANMEFVEDRTAYLTTVLVAVRSHDDPEPLVAYGRLEGMITDQESPVKGFGYDSVFYVPIIHAVLSEVPLATKQTFSHRALACSRLMEAIKTSW